jgi:GT2 family glycosyltransferase
MSEKISVIILNYNGLKYIINCVKSVLTSSHENLEVIVVDNKSTDESIELCEKAFANDKRLKIIKNTSNLGFPEGNNVGANYATGDYLFFLNIDTEIQRETIDNCVQVFRSKSNVAIVQPKLMLLYNRNVFDSTGDFMDKYGNAVRRGGEDLEIDLGQYDYDTDIFSARGAALMVKRSIYSESGGFDSTFFLGFEDIDLCWRIRLMGYNVKLAPSSIVYHVGTEVTRASGKISTRLYHQYKNKVIMLMKNYDTRRLITILPIQILIFYILANAYTMVVRRDLYIPKVRMRAILWVIKNSGKIFRSRRIIQKHLRRVPDEEIIKYMYKSTLWNKSAHMNAFKRTNKPGQ